MAVVVEPQDVRRFKELADSENLEATVVAVVTESPRLVMNWNGRRIVDISRDFLNSNGAQKHIDVIVKKPQKFDKQQPQDFTSGMLALAGDLNVCSSADFQSVLTQR